MSTSAPINADTCPDCVEQQGLCQRHVKSVCPQLKQPSWYRLVGAMHYDQRREESAAARKVRLRKERKRARGIERLVLAINGVRTPSRPAREAA